MNDVKDISASVKAKLKNIFKTKGLDYEDLLKHYAMERFLYRLSKSGHKDKFILKGALMFTAWNVKDRRITLDIDFLGYFDNKESSIIQVVKDIIDTQVIDDGIHFKQDTITSQKLKEGQKHEGVRIKLRAFMGDSRIAMMIDFGFGDKIYPGPANIKYPTLLDMPGPEIKGYTVESVISEKFSAMIEKGETNSRMKDFYDIWLLKKNKMFDRDMLKEALKATFDNRREELPSGEKLLVESFYLKESDKQKEWESFLRNMEIKNAPGTIAEIANEIDSFLREPVEEIKKEISSEMEMGFEM